MTLYAYQEDCEILRSKDFPDKYAGINAVLVDCDGNEVFKLMHGDYTDNQIWEILRIANMTFQRGINNGVLTTQNEIKKALGI